MKKKIIIFTSSGGNGHISATKALQSYLSDEYEIKPVYIFDEIFSGIDPVSFITFGKIHGEDVYNFFLRRRWYSILNGIYIVGNWYFHKRFNFMVALTSDYLAAHKPDLIISVIPVINDVILAAAQKNNIPFILTPTDFDASSFMNGIKAPDYSKFVACLASNDPLVKATSASARLSPSKLPSQDYLCAKIFLSPKIKSCSKSNLVFRKASQLLCS